jgi:hypothetical protein
MRQSPSPWGLPYLLYKVMLKFNMIQHDKKCSLKHLVQYSESDVFQNLMSAFSYGTSAQHADSCRSAYMAVRVHIWI